MGSSKSKLTQEEKELKKGILIVHLSDIYHVVR